jgi:hypothetical protein
VSGYQIEADSADGIDFASVTITGSLGHVQITEMLAELDARRPERILIDESRFRPDLLSSLHIRQFAEQWRNATALNTARIAVHTPSLVMYGLNRMFQMLTAEDRVAVFHTRAEAMAWLLERGPAST